MVPGAANADAVPLPRPVFAAVVLPAPIAAAAGMSARMYDGSLFADAEKKTSHR